MRRSRFSLVLSSVMLALLAQSEHLQEPPGGPHRLGVALPAHDPLAVGNRPTRGGSEVVAGSSGAVELAGEATATHRWPCLDRRASAAFALATSSLSPASAASATRTRIIPVVISAHGMRGSVMASATVYRGRRVAPSNDLIYLSLIGCRHTSRREVVRSGERRSRK